MEYANHTEGMSAANRLDFLLIHLYHHAIEEPRELWAYGRFKSVLLTTNNDAPLQRMGEYEEKYFKDRKEGKQVVSSK